MSEPGFFEILDNTRAIKRLKPDPVPFDLIRRVLDAGTKAPSGVNTQPWEFLVVRDPGTKKWVQERDLHFARERFGTVEESLDTPHARMLRTVMHLAEHLHEAPVLLFVCGHRDWPAAVPIEKRVGKAPPPYGSIYPCVQNILLACRAIGLGASLTTIHHMFEEELAQQLGVPDEVSLVALLPIGFPRGRFGPVTRTPARDLTHFDSWGHREPRGVEPMNITSSDPSAYGEITKVVQRYIVGARSGRGDVMKPAFHEHATVFGFVGADLFAGPIQQLFDWSEEDGPAQGLEARIASIDLVDTIATVRLELDDWNGRRFTDLFTLLRVDGEWKIMNKVFHLYLPEGGQLSS